MSHSLWCSRAIICQLLYFLVEGWDADLSPCNFATFHFPSETSSSISLKPHDHPFDSLHSEVLSLLNLLTHEMEDPLVGHPKKPFCCSVLFPDGFQGVVTVGKDSLSLSPPPEGDVGPHRLGPQGANREEDPRVNVACEASNEGADHFKNTHSDGAAATGLKESEVNQSRRGFTCALKGEKSFQTVVF